MDTAKFEQLVSLHNEGKGAQQISQIINLGHGIVDWYLLFIRMHGEQAAIDFNAGLGRGRYTRDEILGIHNFVLTSGASYERAEIYFKIKRNKLLARVKQYIGAENLRTEVPDVPKMEPPVEIKRYLITAELPAELKKDANTSTNVDVPVVVVDKTPTAAQLKEAAMETISAEQMQDGKVHLSSTESFATFAQDVSVAVEPQPEATRIFGRARAKVQEPQRQKVMRNKSVIARRDAQLQAVLKHAPRYTSNVLFHLWGQSIRRGLTLTSLDLYMFFFALVQQSQAFAYFAIYGEPVLDESKVLVDKELEDRKKIQPPAVTIEDKINFYLGPMPERVPASSFKPGTRAKLPRIDSQSEGFDALPEHLKEKIYARELLEDEIRKAAANLIRSEDSIDIKKHELIKWRFKAACYLMEQNKEWPKSLIKKMLNISSNDFCYYATNTESLDPYSVIRPMIVECFHKNRTPGHRMLSQYLRRQYGVYLCRPVIRRLMKECSLEAPSQKKAKKPYSSHVKGLGEFFPNLLNRDFSSTIFGHKIVTDISEFVVNGIKVYLSIFLDIATNMIIAATVSLSPSVAMVVDGLKAVLARVPKDTIIILHSDQGHHYKRAAYIQEAIEDGRVLLSNSALGCCYDNGECEGRFSIVKHEMFNGQKFDSVDDFVNKLFEYFTWSNMYRVSTALGGLTPMEAKTMLDRGQSLAA